MKRAIILGSTNVGKTLFMINFAEYVGLKKVIIKFEYPGGNVLKKEMSIDIARLTLSSNIPHKTKCLQSVTIKISVYKGSKEFQITDSSGLTDGIHPETNIRNGIAQTIENIKNSQIILHIVDVSQYNNNLKCMLSEIDRQIIRFGSERGRYALLANKIDLDKSNNGVDYLKRVFTGVYVIPISALNKHGFDEVKTFVTSII